jgi:hypothetical protein
MDAQLASKRKALRHKSAMAAKHERDNFADFQSWCVAKWAALLSGKTEEKRNPLPAGSNRVGLVKL